MLLFIYFVRAVYQLICDILLLLQYRRFSDVSPVFRNSINQCIGCAYQWLSFAVRCVRFLLSIVCRPHVFFYTIFARRAVAISYDFSVILLLVYRSIFQLSRALIIVFIHLHQSCDLIQCVLYVCLFYSNSYIRV